MVKTLIQPVILCGGGGTRLWPLSTDRLPKQFLTLTGARSMLAETAARVGDPARFGPVLAVGALRHGARLRAELPAARMLLEPSGRNSAPAVAAAALLAEPDALLLVLPADHHIADVPAFHAAIEKARPAVEHGRIVTFGITPDRPATGYGYIKTEGDAAQVAAVDRFVEKPDLETAQSYLAEGGYFWNAGIFFFRADVMLAAFEAHAPDILADVRGALAPDGSLDAERYGRVRSESIDYAVMEHADNIAVVGASMGWSDIGDFHALYALGREDGGEGDNVTSGPVAADAASGCLALSHGPLIALHGVEGLAVAATREAVLITPLDRTAEIRGTVMSARDLPALRLDASPRQRIGEWLFQRCLPHWAEHAWDEENGGFVEALDIASGAPLQGRPRRGRVTPRQIYAFASAKECGWNPAGRADDLVARGLAYLDGPARAPGGGWAHVMGPDGVVDPRRDLYDHAFVALAGAQAFAAGHATGRALAEEAFEFIDAQFADPDGRGWRDTETHPPQLRRANPHMHLLEASLGMYAATSAQSALRRAGAVAALFESRMFDPQSGAVMEKFSADWDRPTEALIEPGHCYEWAYFLYRLDAVSGRDTESWRRRLIRFGETAGLQDGFAVDAAATDGPKPGASKRLWPQLERFRALLHHAETMSDPAAVLDRILDAYLAPGPAWGWVDRLDAAGRPNVAEVPASMLYHVMTGLAPVAIAPADQ